MERKTNKQMRIYNTYTICTKQTKYARMLWEIQYASKRHCIYMRILFVIYGHNESWVDGDGWNGRFCFIYTQTRRFTYMKFGRRKKSPMGHSKTIWLSGEKLHKNIKHWTEIRRRQKKNMDPIHWFPFQTKWLIFLCQNTHKHPYARAQFVQAHILW